MSPTGRSDPGRGRTAVAPAPGTQPEYLWDFRMCKYNNDLNYLELLAGKCRMGVTFRIAEFPKN